ncbi:LLM class F420-dependent oxidoreductase [Actinocrinis puniceicyclus]|uniref:LLM class F420-dependent oxidoreductase n=1 Tax=Actinocrinis puniceicyclus TaxID=977794 RepID=A0A8J7WPS0_9ACTN|nr:LLM class F420-dependent oxidoreductase [Actinocrinis puniceicyclus]MBS2963300.1 LLM class F420-dependent oxidoreductase [Actinocrinis puniceicyclus]
MQLRIFTEPQQGATYDTQLTIAKAAEDLGFDGFFRSDHYLKMGEVSGLPGPTDAWITLAGLARETSRIRLGTLVSPATFRLPGPLAIQVAQVDRMSGGRVELGLGTGWFGEEHAAYGIPFPDKRFELLEEQLAIVTGLWDTPQGQTFSFAGEHYRLVDSPALPKPAQRPHPPVIVGGSGPTRTPRLAARYADEFNANFCDLQETAASFARVRAATAQSGRDPDSLILSAASTTVVGKDDAEVARRAEAAGVPVEWLREKGYYGTPGEVVDTLGRLKELGATRIYLQIRDLADLDHLELIAAEVAPQLG